MNLIKKAVCSAIFFPVLMSSAFAAYQGKMDSTLVPGPGKFYLGFFGGPAGSNSFDASQYGTAFYPDAAGGPLAVNAFGNVNSNWAWLAGAQVGYEAPEILLKNGSQWWVTPAIELEGYNIGNSSLTSDLLNNTARLPEHDFDVTYPMNRRVFLTNFVLDFDNHCWLFHPYVGLGVGGALVKITGANATQIAPAEPDINHYNSSNTDSDATFAGQIKLGLSYDVTSYASVFAEYRWLYIASTDFVFGSTVAPGHVETSSWQVDLNSQRLNMGTIGVKFSV